MDSSPLTLEGADVASTVFVDPNLVGAERIGDFLVVDGWRVVTNEIEILPMSIALVSVKRTTDLDPWMKLMRFGRVRGIAVGDGSDTDLVIAVLSKGFDQFVDHVQSDRVLLAQVRSVSRRRTDVSVMEPGFVLNPKVLSLEVGEQSVDLSPSEFAVLLALSQKVGSAVSKKILADVSGTRGPDSLDSLVRRVRNKLESLEGVRRIRTIRGFGFILEKQV